MVIVEDYVPPATIEQAFEQAGLHALRRHASTVASGFRPWGR